jgi:hypothetical protein
VECQYTQGYDDNGCVFCTAEWTDSDGDSMTEYCEDFCNWAGCHDSEDDSEEEACTAEWEDVTSWDAPVTDCPTDNEIVADCYYT